MTRIRSNLRRSPGVLPRRRRARSARGVVRRGFSLIEMMVAMSISGALLTATLVALDTSFQSYKHTTETASTHVVGRLLIHRLSTLVRTGENFGPAPANPVFNPVIGDDAGEPDGRIEFEVIPDPEVDARQVWIIERVAVAGDTGPFELRATVEYFENGVLVNSGTRTLIRRVSACTFLLEYDIGPRLRRARIDLTLLPDDTGADRMEGGGAPRTVRFVTSMSPRGLIDFE